MAIKIRENYTTSMVKKASNKVEELEVEVTFSVKCSIEVKVDKRQDLRK